MRARESVNLLYQMTRCAFLAHEKNSALGMLWHLLNPLAMSLVLYLVFSNITSFYAPFAGHSRSYYPLFILVGIVTFNFFSQATVRAAEGMLNARSLVLNTTVPRETLVLRSVCLDGVTYLIELALVATLVALLGGGLGWQAFFIGFVVAGTFMLTLGSALLVAGAVVFLTDLTYVWGVLTRILFFVTPIFYRVEMLDHPFAGRLLALNPLTGLVTLGRRCLLDGQALAAGEIGAALLGPLVALALGWIVFQRLKPAIPDAI
jgi:ABC-type polysaccharide/polyol phosphate export permease